MEQSCRVPRGCFLVVSFSSIHSQPIADFGFQVEENILIGGGSKSFFKFFKMAKIEAMQ
jgi:hypothetical protein